MNSTGKAGVFLPFVKAIVKLSFSKVLLAFPVCHAHRSPTDIGYQFIMPVSTAEWNKKGAALSDKSARKEFGLTQEQIIGAINSGKLQYRQNHIHGNPYFRLLRDEVEELAKELIGLEKLKHTQIQNELSQVIREINKFKRQIKVLEKRKTELSSLMNEKDFC